MELTSGMKVAIEFGLELEIQGCQRRYDKCINEKEKEECKVQLEAALAAKEWIKLQKTRSHS